MEHKLPAKYHNYLIIAVLSFISVFFLPMLGSSVGMGFILPTTAAGWVVYLITKICIVLINLLIFDQFIKQAKVNVKDNPYFQKAEAILMEQRKEDEEILPATTYIHKMYHKKAALTAIFTALGVFGFTNAILTFDWVSMLSYLFTVILGLVMGFINMKEAEEIWIEKHYRYAVKVQLENEQKAREHEKAREEACQEVLNDSI